MSIGNILIGLGLLLIVLGLAYKVGILNWMGNLPGDIKYESGSTKFYFPIVTMILVSVVLSIILSLFKR